MFSCGVCHKSFAKHSTLVRHQQNHQETKVYTCDECNASFKRQDLLTRHQKIVHHRHNDPSVADGSESTSTSRSRKRARTVCEQCRKDRVRCDGQVPCMRCTNKQKDCIFAENVGRLSKDSRVSTTEACLTHPPRSTHDGGRIDRPSKEKHKSNLAQTFTPELGVATLASNQYVDDALLENTSYRSLPLTTISPPSGPISSQNEWSRHTEATFLTLHDIRTTLQPKPLQEIASHYPAATFAENVYTSTRNPTSPSRTPNSASHTILESTGHLMPSHERVISSLLEAATAWTKRSLALDFPEEDLDVTSFRDQITSLSLEMQEEMDFQPPGHGPFPVRCFQGLHALDDMAELFLQHSCTIWQLFPRFSRTAGNTHPLLYLIIAATGALFGNKSSIAFGADLQFRLQEVLVETWLDCGKPTEEMNLQVAQARALTKAAALFYGNRRTFLYAQRIGSVLMAQAWRMNLFCSLPLRFTVIAKGNEDWLKKWIRFESRNRLAYCIMRLEMFTGLIYSVRPGLRFEELDIELPCSRHLWQNHFPHGSDFVAAIMKDQAASAPPVLFSDIMRITVESIEDLPPLDHFAHELLISALQDKAWSAYHDGVTRDRMMRSQEPSATTVSDGSDSYREQSFVPEYTRLARSYRKSTRGPPSRQRLINSVDASIERVTSALQKWYMAFLEAGTPVSISDRTSTFNCQLLYHLSFLRLLCPLDMIHDACYRSFRDQVDPERVAARISSWLSQPAAHAAVKHAITIFDMIQQELQKPFSARAYFHYPPMAGTLHSAAVVWTYASVQPEPQAQTLSLDGIALIQKNTATLMRSFVRQFNDGNPMDDCRTLFGSYIARLETMQFSDIYAISA